MPKWVLLTGRPTKGIRAEVCAVRASPFGDWLEELPRFVQAEILFMSLDIGRPEAVSKACSLLRSLKDSKRFKKVVSFAAVEVPVAGCLHLRLGLILPYFHHIPFWMKPLKERDIVLHYSASTLEGKGTDFILSLLPEIERAGYRLVVLSWYPRPEGIPPSVEWVSKVGLSKVFELTSRARAFVTATTWDSWSRSALYSLKFRTPIAFLDRGSVLGMWMREFASGVTNRPERLGICEEAAEFKEFLLRVLTDDDAWQEVVDRWEGVIHLHPLWFDEYTIAEVIKEGVAPLPADFIPIHFMLHAKRECFPSDLPTCGEDTRLV